MVYCVILAHCMPINACHQVMIRAINSRKVTRRQVRGQKCLSFMIIRCYTTAAFTLVLLACMVIMATWIHIWKWKITRIAFEIRSKSAYHYCTKHSITRDKCPQRRIRRLTQAWWTWLRDGHMAQILLLNPELHLVCYNTQMSPSANIPDAATDCLTPSRKRSSWSLWLL